MAEEPVVAIILFFVGFLVGLGSLATGYYSETNLPGGTGSAVAESSANRLKIAGYAIAGFCFIGLVRTTILLLF
jgi:hypothetical protein